MKIPLKQKAYDYVLDKIICGDLKPGQRMSEVAMAKEIGLSPTPLREAYRQLASEGFVTHVPNSGIFVRELTDREIAELYETREALETFATRKAAQRMNSVEIDELKECYKIQLAIGAKLRLNKKGILSPKQETEYMKADARFHLLIFNAAENSVIMKTMRECHIMRNLLSFRSHEHNLKQVNTTLEQHAGIIAAIEKHDADAADLQMRKHIQFSAKTALENRRKGNVDYENGEGQELNRYIYQIEGKS